MTFLDLACKRYSCRKFVDKKVEQDKIEKILEAGRVAPTAVNFQSQRIFVLQSKESLEKLKTVTQYHFNAPLAFLVCYDNKVSWKNPFNNTDEGIVDASIVTVHMMLQTADLGLGSTWVGYFDLKVAQKTYNLADNIIPVAILTVGYPDAGASNMHANRYELSKTVEYL